MNNRERFLRTMHYAPVDHRPLHLVEPWPDTLARWRREGLPAEVDDVNAYLGVEPLRLINITGTAGIYPPFSSRILREEGEFVVSVDPYGRTVRNFKSHTSMPEWLDFPVKTAQDLRRILDEHFDVEHLDERYPPDWRHRFQQARKRTDAVIMLDGGCYYWTLRSLAGVEGASYLLHDAVAEVDELFERYCTVVLDGLRRLLPRIHVDVIGFGEDIAAKGGPLMSPTMFRRFILPRYQRAMDWARQEGVGLTWYDSDGDLRLLVPDYLSIGINGLAPCEVAAGMDPVELRRRFGQELRLIGGFDKRLVARGRAAIDAEFLRLQPLIEEGGFLPAIDHSVSSDISFDDYRYYVDAAQKASGM